MLVTLTMFMFIVPVKMRWKLILMCMGYLFTIWAMYQILEQTLILSTLLVAVLLTLFYPISQRNLMSEELS